MSPSPRLLVCVKPDPDTLGSKPHFRLGRRILCPAQEPDTHARAPAGGVWTGPGHRDGALPPKPAN